MRDPSDFSDTDFGADYEDFEDDLLRVPEQANAALNALQEIQNMAQAMLDDEPEKDDIDTSDERYPALTDAYRLMREAKAALGKAHHRFLDASS